MGRSRKSGKFELRPYTPEDDSEEDHGAFNDQEQWQIKCLFVILSFVTEFLMNLLLIALTCTGLFAVGLCFLFLFPVIGKMLVVLFSAYNAEQLSAKRKNEESGTTFIDPNELEVFKQT